MLPTRSPHSTLDVRRWTFNVLTLLLFCLSALALPAHSQTRILPLTAGRAPAEGTAQTHWRANPLTVRLTLDAGRPTATGWETITAEIRKSVTDTTTALASVTLSTPTGAGPFDLTFTGAQLNQSLAGAPSATFWLVLYSTDNSGETLDILHAGKLVLLEHAASLTAPSPPNPVGVLTRTAADALYRALANVVPLSGIPLLDATAHVSNEIDSRIAGKTAASGTQLIFSTINHAAGTYVRSSTAWTAGVDLTGIGVARQTSGTWSTHLGFAAVSPRHVVLCHHSIIPDASVLRFVTAAGVPVDRTLSNSARVGTTDIRVGLLSSALPDTITPLALLPVPPGGIDPDTGLFIPTGTLPMATAVPVLSVDQEFKALVSVINNLAADAVGFATGAAPRDTWYEAGADGDSGHVVCVLFEGRPVLLSHYTTATSGPRYLPADIQATANGLLAGYTIATRTMPRTVDWTALTGRPTITSTPAAGVVPLTDGSGKIPSGFINAASTTWSDVSGKPFTETASIISAANNGKAYTINSSGTISAVSSGFNYSLNLTGSTSGGGANSFQAAGFGQAFAGVGGSSSTLDASGTATNLTFRQIGQAGLGENTSNYFPRLTIAANGALDWPGLAGATAKFSTRENLGLGTTAGVQLASLGLGTVPGTVIGGQTTSLAATGYTGLGGLRVGGADTANTIFQPAGNLALTAGAGSVTLGAGVSAAQLVVSGTGASLAGDLTVTGNITGSLAILGGGLVVQKGAGNSLFLHNGSGNFDMIQFAGVTAAFPAIKRSGATLQLRLADDSGFASLSAGNLTTSGTLFANSIGSNPASVSPINIHNNAGGGINNHDVSLAGRYIVISGRTGIDLQDTNSANNPVYIGGRTASFPMFRRSGANLLFRNGADTGYTDIEVRNVIQSPPASVTPASNGDLLFEATSNTSVTIKMRGTDGVVRSAVLTLAP